MNQFEKLQPTQDRAPFPDVKADSVATLTNAERFFGLNQRELRLLYLYTYLNLEQVSKLFSEDLAEDMGQLTKSFISKWLAFGQNPNYQHSTQLLEKLGLTQLFEFDQGTYDRSTKNLRTYRPKPETKKLIQAIRNYENLTNPQPAEV